MKPDAMGLRELSSDHVISIDLSFAQVTSRNVPLTVFLIMVARWASIDNQDHEEARYFGLGFAGLVDFQTSWARSTFLHNPTISNVENASKHSQDAIQGSFPVFRFL
jgi:hypothetical protein